MHSVKRPCQRLQQHMCQAYRQRRQRKQQALMKIRVMNPKCQGNRQCWICQKWPSGRASTPHPGFPTGEKGCHSTCIPKPALPHWCLPWDKRSPYLVLGPEEGELLRKRRVVERRRIFAQRGSRGPDDSPFGEHNFDPSLDYRSVEWGQPVPQEEWERRVYVELNLATDLRYEGKGARPECHACRRRGSREVPLAKC
eukprot:6463267-Amphidinium_carterae.1